MESMERATGFEPATASLEGWDSTPELRPPFLDWHSKWNIDSNALNISITNKPLSGRFPDKSSVYLIVSHSAKFLATHDYRMHDPFLNLRKPTTVHFPERPTKIHLVGRQGFEPWKLIAADLQSAPVVHLGTCPFIINPADGS